MTNNTNSIFNKWQQENNIVTITLKAYTFRQRFNYIDIDHYKDNTEATFTFTYNQDDANCVLHVNKRKYTFKISNKSTNDYIEKSKYEFFKLLPNIINKLYDNNIILKIHANLDQSNQSRNTVYKRGLFQGLHHIIVTHNKTNPLKLDYDALYNIKRLAKCKIITHNIITSICNYDTYFMTQLIHTICTHLVQNNLDTALKEVSTIQSQLAINPANTWFYNQLNKQNNNLNDLVSIITTLNKVATLIRVSLHKSLGLTSNT